MDFADEVQVLDVRTNVVMSATRQKAQITAAKKEVSSKATMRTMVSARLRKELYDYNAHRKNHSKRATIMRGLRSNDENDPFFTKRMDFLTEICNEIVEQTYELENNRRGYLSTTK